MKINRAITKYLVLISDLIDDVEVLLDGEIEEEQTLFWREKAETTLAKILGENHIYVKEFSSIDFSVSFSENLEDLLAEDIYRLALEDARSYLISLMDELESEHNSTPGLMDMESLFAEMNRYVSVYVEDTRMRSSLHHRITRLRNGMMSGDISSDEVKNHIKHIGYMDTGLFERIIPLLTWYYMQRMDGNRATNN
ncbi:MAG: hypothetical protein RRA35_01915 [Desulfomonilia bacterium]|nr:hypothetical protein [Desulfomonilia bacterium]